MLYKIRNIRWTLLTAPLVLFLGIFVAFSANCSAQPASSEEVALRSLREATSGGKLPAESIVQNIENRFSGTSTGVLARLIRARIRLEANDPAGAADILNTELFAQRTGLGDYAMWLRGKALTAAGKNVDAQRVFSDFVSKFPGSMRVRDARLLWAESLISTGQADRVPGVLVPLVESNDGKALMLTARSFEMRGQNDQAVGYLRRTYFFAAGSDAAREAEEKLTALKESLEPKDREEILARADNLYKKGQHRDAAEAFDSFARSYPASIDSNIQLKRVTSNAKSRQMPAAAFIFEKLPDNAKEKPEAYYQMAVGYASSRDWTSVSGTIAGMRSRFPASKWTPKAMVAVGNIAGDQRRLTDKNFYLRTTLAAFPDSVENVDAQFELAWNQHELKNFEESSKLLIEHLARYVDKDTSYRGQSGYWAARDSERSGNTDEACALYDGTVYRYGANWYGYQALQRLVSLRRVGKCQTTPKFPANSLIPKAIANLKVITVAAESATEQELSRARKSEELSTVGLFDWAIEELEEAKKTADTSPKINLALAKHYRLKGDNVKALLALKTSYPDYPQMFPEEMGREEWDIFYPLTHWNDIKFWAGKRNLDPFNVAGLIRQETIFNPKARSSANAYGLMQLLIPTARMMARKYGTQSGSISGSALFYAPLNIELGTAYMREQLSKYGTIEYMSVAYNAGPGRVVSWKRTLPLEMDEFVEEIPFRETRGYVKGVIRNSSQYRRLYDEAGRFKQNVGANAVRAGIDKMSPEQFSSQYPEVKVENEKRRGD